MNHNEIRHKLSDYIDESVTGVEKAVIEEHLTICADCSEALRELRKTIEQVKQIEEVDTPAWMTSKIMATVRAEQASKKSFWQRFMNFISYRPAQAVAVLFLAVISYYIYTNINPAAKYSEEPSTKLSQQKASREIQELPASASQPAQHSEKKVAQGSGYKSLDMKYEYEKPAAPKPQEQPAAVPPAKQEIQSSKDESETNAITPHLKAKTAAPAPASEQAVPPPPTTGLEAFSQTASPRTKEMMAAEPCLSYGPVIVVLNGVMGKRDFPGPPEYRSIMEGDRKETYWILKTTSPFCVQGKRDNSPENQSEQNITEVQLVMTPNLYDSYRPLLNRPVSVHGTLFHAITGHHRTPVLLTVQTITPHDK